MHLSQSFPNRLLFLPTQALTFASYDDKAVTDRCLCYPVTVLFLKPVSWMLTYYEFVTRERKEISCNRIEWFSKDLRACSMRLLIQQFVLTM